MTDLMRAMSEDERAAAIARSGSLSPFKTPEQGAATSVWCATSRQLEGAGGVYCEDVDIAVPVAADFSGPYGVRPWATDPELAERLWMKSEEWSGVTLPD